MIFPAISLRRLALCLAPFLSVTAASAQQLEGGGPVPAGDPTLFFADGYYYLFSTGDRLPIYRSKDARTWSPMGRLFEAVPAWARAAVPRSSNSMWAPDIVRIGDEYRAYWSLSSLGSRQSVIGFSSNRTLDPASPAYHWTDRGRVIGTTDADDWNAIDPQCFVDQQSRVWLLAGSYWSGIKVRRLDANTGKLSDQDTKLYAIASRAGVTPPAIEGAYAIWRDGYYYLFVSFGVAAWGVHSPYHLRVGRARDITGPFVDRAGRPLLRGGGTLVLASHGLTRGPGHNSVLQRGDETLLACHVFNPAEGGQRTLQIRPMYWDRRGWPVVGEPVRAVSLPPAATAGRWNYSLDFDEPMEITLEPGGGVEQAGAGAAWVRQGDKLVLTWKKDGGRKPLVEECFLAPDGASFVGRNAHGQIVRGIRIGD